jgi:uncharacterized protein
MDRSRQHAIDYIEFSVADMTDSKRFYGEAFGWTFTDYGPEYAGIRKPDGSGECGGLCIAKTIVPGGPLVILYSSALEDSLRQVLAAGGRITQDIFSFPGGRRFHFADPSGNELAVWSDQPPNETATSDSC